MRARLWAFLHHLRSEHTTPGRLAAAVFVGLFFGIVPFYGVQTPICIAVASLLGLNRLTVVGAAQISNPLFAPGLIAAGIALGEWMRYGRLQALDLQQAGAVAADWGWMTGQVSDLYLSCLLGDTVLAVVIGAAGAAATYAWRLRTGIPLPGPGDGAGPTEVVGEGAE